MEGLGQHQVDRGIAAIDDVLTDLGEVSLLGLDAESTGVSLVALARLEVRVAELKHRVLVAGQLRWCGPADPSIRTCRAEVGSCR